MFYINNMTQMPCNFKEQSKIVSTGGGGGGLKPSQATPQQATPHLSVSRYRMENRQVRSASARFTRENH